MKVVRNIDMTNRTEVFPIILSDFESPKLLNTNMQKLVMTVKCFAIFDTNIMNFSILQTNQSKFIRFESKNVLTGVRIDET